MLLTLYTKPQRSGYNDVLHMHAIKTVRRSLSSNNNK